jgi:diaminopimelate decarboxylase
MLAKTSTKSLDTLAFLAPNQVQDVAKDFGTPVYVYSEQVLRARAQEIMAFPAPFGLTVRYAMKANPLAAVLGVFKSEGIHIDASSGYEVHRAIKAGFRPDQIMLTSQELPPDLVDLVEKGVIFNASSLHQLESYGRNFPGRNVSVRFNCGLGSGHTRSVSVAGRTSSFGVWHEQLDEVQRIASNHHLKITTIHSHIGCGSDPDIWQQAASLTLALVEKLPSVTTLNLGGGFKVARMAGEHATDIRKLGQGVSALLEDFAKQSGRQLHLELEPGTFLAANSGSLVSRVHDITSTGESGFTFLKLDTGMNDFMRPALHASQHPIIVLSQSDSADRYVVVGHNCESTDLFTPHPSDAERPYPRTLRQAAIGDLVVIEGVGAYSSAMRLIGYNSFPSPAELMLEATGKLRLIRRRQGWEDFANAETA